MNKYQYKVQGVDYEVEIEEVEGNIAKVNVNGIPFEVELQQPINAAKHPNIVKPKVQAPAASVQTNPQPQPKQAAQLDAAGAGNALRAPLPGTINAIQIKVGDKVVIEGTTGSYKGAKQIITPTITVKSSNNTFLIAVFSVSIGVSVCVSSTAISRSASSI